MATNAYSAKLRCIAPTLSKAFYGQVPNLVSSTSGYSHGHATELKRTLLQEWADHIEGVVQPSGVAVLR